MKYSRCHLTIAILLSLVFWLNPSPSLAHVAAPCAGSTTLNGFDMRLVEDGGTGLFHVVYRMRLSREIQTDLMNAGYGNISYGFVSPTIDTGDQYLLEMSYEAGIAEWGLSVQFPTSLCAISTSYENLENVLTKFYSGSVNFEVQNQLAEQMGAFGIEATQAWEDANSFLEASILADVQAATFGERRPQCNRLLRPSPRCAPTFLLASDDGFWSGAADWAKTGGGWGSKALGGAGFVFGGAIGGGGGGAVGTAAAPGPGTVCGTAWGAAKGAAAGTVIGSIAGYGIGAVGGFGAYCVKEAGSAAIDGIGACAEAAGDLWNWAFGDD